MRKQTSTPLVLVPGLLSNERVWEHQVHHLRDVTDLQIFCPTQNHPDKMVEALLNAAPPTFALAGHSMGGWLCLEILRAAPSRVAKLCLLNTSARDDSQEKRARRQEMIARSKNGAFRTILQETLGFFTYNPLVRPAVEAMFLEVGCQTFIDQEEAMLLRKPCQSILPTIRCPTLILHAAQDQNFTLEENLELAEKIPHAKLAIVEDCGHMSPMEMPQAITSWLRFWLSY